MAVINLTLKNGEQIFIKVEPEKLPLLMEKLKDFGNGGDLDLTDFEVMQQLDGHNSK